MLTLSGSTGLLRVANATSAPVGTFRVQVLWDYFSSNGFLCNGATVCNSQQEDKASHFGATFAASATVTSFLEGYVAIRSFANSNDQGRPELLQVLGDTTIGAKLFMPAPTEAYRLFNVGGDLQLLLLNGSGGVGLDGGSTSFRGRVNSTFDFRTADGGLPLLAHVNLGYRFDNSGKIVEPTEEKRGNRPITRIERFGLGINRVDAAEIGVALEGMFQINENVRWLRPFVEYTIDIPVNRQNYACPSNRIDSGDACLQNESSFRATPSRLTGGLRVNPYLKGLMLTGAVDIGLSGTSVFLQEVAPQAPWTVWWGIGYGFDVVERPPVIKTLPPVERIVQSAAPPQYFVQGTVHEAGSAVGVPNAIVRFDGRDMTGMVTDNSGKFRTANVEPGTYTFKVKADGYKDGTCSVTVTAGGDAGQPPPPMPPPGAPPGAMPPMGAPPGGDMPGGPPPAAPPGSPPTGNIISDVDCSLEALPKMGNMTGSVVNADGAAGIGGATVTLIDAANKERTAVADSAGRFRFDGLPPGSYKLRAAGDGYLGGLGQGDVRPREDAKVIVSMNKRPKTPKVTVGRREIILRQQVHFETNSAQILSDSAVLLEELADVMNKNPKIKKVEIQGHTDNQGASAFNKTLSEQRASAVRDRLVSLGVSASRLDAKGYGSERPIVPNITANNRARNRRVAIIITDQDKLPSPRRPPLRLSAGPGGVVNSTRKHPPCPPRVPARSRCSRGSCSCRCRPAPATATRSPTRRPPPATRRRPRRSRWSPPAGRPGAALPSRRPRRPARRRSRPRLRARWRCRWPRRLAPPRRPRRRTRST
jgi:outer membrane protein OmpA-like peptidoglycan-associated protein